MKFLRLSLVFSLFIVFSSGLYANRGAGICPIFDDGTVALGKETRTYNHGPNAGQQYNVWSDYGGKSDYLPAQGRLETLAETAYREFIEETGYYTFGVGSPYNIQLRHVQQAEANGHFADHNHQGTGQFYRTYFVRIPGQKPDINTFHRNATLAKKNLGPNAHVEKTDWQYFDAQVLKNAPFQNGNLPGTNEPLFGPFKAVIRQASAQNYLQNVVPLPQPQPQPQPTPQQKRKPTRVKQKQVRQKVKRTRLKQCVQKRKRIHVKQRISKRKTRVHIRRKATKHTSPRVRVKRTQ